MLTFMQVQSIPNLKLLELLRFYNTNLKNNRQFKKYNFSGEKELELVKTCRVEVYLPKGQYVVDDVPLGP